MKLPIYNEIGSVAIEESQAKPPNPKCSECMLSQTAPRVCTGPRSSAQKGGILVLGGAITKDAAQRGVPFSGQAFMRMKAFIDKHTEGPVTYDNCIRCPLPPYGALKTSTGKAIDGATFSKTIYSKTEPCSGYTRHIIDQIEPERIILLGKYAANQVLGDALLPDTVRRAYRFTSTGTPVFLMPDLLTLEGNLLREKQFLKDLLWALKVTPQDEFIDETYEVVSTPEQMAEAFDALKGKEVVYDVETTGILYKKDWFNVICLGIGATDTTHTYVISSAGLQSPEVCDKLRTLLEDPTTGKIGSNINYDNQSVAFDPNIRATVPKVSHDTLIINKNLDTTQDCHLEVMAETVGMGGHKKEFKAAQEAAHKKMSSAKRKLTMLEKKGKDTSEFLDSLPKYIQGYLLYGRKVQAWSFAGVDEDILHRYCARDVVSTKFVCRRHRSILKNYPNIQFVWDEILNRSIPLVDYICKNGMYIDLHQLKIGENHLDNEIAVLKTAISNQGIENPNSATQIAKKLYGPKAKGGLGLKPPINTEAGEGSTSAEALKLIPDPPKLVTDILDLRKVSKLKTSYFSKIPLFEGYDGRVRGTYKLGQTDTGRLSMTDPPLQTIPRGKGSKYGKLLKQCFKPQNGRIFCQVDYSQIELRVAALLSNDKTLIQVFKDGIDPHLKTAKAAAKFAFNMDPDDILPGSEQRSLSKAITFGLLYGQAIESIAKTYGVELGTVQKLADTVMGVYKDLAKWSQSQEVHARRTGLTYTQWKGQIARQRNIMDIAYTGRNKTLRKTAGTCARSSYNTPCQGTASDFCLNSACRIYEALQENTHLDAMIIGLVHDSILSECADCDLEEYLRLKHFLMCDYDTNEIPIDVDVEVGQNWAELETYQYIARQETEAYDHRYIETRTVESGIKQLLVRKDKESEQWVDSYLFNPLVVSLEDSISWLHTKNMKAEITKPWL